MTEWKIVPVTATNGMCECGAAHEGPVPPISTSQADYAYAAMLTASPDASQDDELVERVAVCLWKADKSKPGWANTLARACIQEINRSQSND